MTQSGRKTILRIIRYAVSITIMVALALLIDWNRFLTLLSRSRIYILMIAPLFLLLGTVVASFRWKLLLAQLHIFKSLKNLIRYYLAAAFYNTVLPGVIGGDVVRIGLCAKNTGKKIGIISSSVLVERSAGLFALFGMGSVFLFILPSNLKEALGPHILKIVPLIMLLSIILLIIFISIRKRTNRFSSYHGSKRFFQEAVNIINSIRYLPLLTIFSLIAFSALFQATDILAAFTIAKALHLSITLPFLFALMPIVYLATILPVSIGGLGAREGILVFFLSRADIILSDAIALSFLIYINRVVLGLIGGILQFRWNGKNAQPVGSPLSES